MTGYLWLVWYHAATRNSPKHWVLMVTYHTEDESFGTSYHVYDDGLALGCHDLSIVRGVPLTGDYGKAGYQGRLLLGAIKDSYVEAMELYAETAMIMLNERNRAEGNGRLNCQDWSLYIIESLEDGRCLPRGTWEMAKKVSADWLSALAVIAAERCFCFRGREGSLFILTQSPAAGD